MFRSLVRKTKRAKRPAKAAARFAFLRVEPLETRDLLSSLVAVQDSRLATVAPRAVTQAVYSQPPSASGGLIASSWVDPNGSDSDVYVYDNFTLQADAAITEVDWRGGYIYGAMYGKASNFTVTFFDSIAGGSQPLVTNPQLPETYLAKFNVGGTAGETPAGTIGGVAMYDYHYVLPTTFQATANHTYWVRVEASQPSYPDWGIAVGTGGNNQHFQFSTGSAHFSFGASDAAFTLLTSTAATCTISASASPVAGGTVSGTGAYPVGSTATVVATPNTDFTFVNWTENGQPVSDAPSYSFMTTGDRSLVANFTAAATISLSASPAIGGSVSGGGSYIAGTSVTVSAMPNSGYLFVNWTENGSPVSTTASYSFTASVSRLLVANFSLLNTSATFDFDSGTPPVAAHQSLPAEQSFNGVTAYFSSPNTYALGFSVQSDASTQFRLSQFSGNYLYPNSVYSPILDIHFNRHLTSILFTFATADFQQVEVPTTVQVTGYDTSTANPPVGSASGHGTYAGDTMPMGSLTFTSAVPFDVVEIKIPPSPLAASGFLIDNIVVATTGALFAPTITWPAPAAITYGTPLNTSQLNATADVPGTFAYSPPLGAVLPAGSQTLSVTFTPTDAANYATATASVPLNVQKALPTITWPTPADIVLGDPLTSAQLNAAADVTGSFVYAPAAGAVLSPGSRLLSATFTPSDAANYAIATASVQLNVMNRWHNYTKPLDITGDGHIVAGDALAIINYINAYNSGPVPPNATAEPPYYDADNDGHIAPIDALLVINQINAGGGGEGDAAVAPAGANAALSGDLLTLLATDAFEQGAGGQRRR